MPWFRRDKSETARDANRIDEAPAPDYPPLSGDCLADVEAKRSWVRGFVHDHARGDFDASWQVKLDTLTAIIEQAGLLPNQTVELQALGITLGDAIVQRCGAAWVQVTDEYGTDPAVFLGGPRNAIVFPMTMISKRIENGETVNANTLHGLVEHANGARSLGLENPT